MNGWRKDMKKVHYDNSAESWVFYQLIYDDLTNKKMFKSGSNSIAMSGDICFNFNDIKTKNFKEIILSDKSIDDKVKNKLYVLIDKCRDYHHAPCNISILPKTGGINNTKQSIGNDRLDSFIWALSLYYQGFKTLIKDNGSSPKMAFENRKALDSFLTSFSEGPQQFCKKIYQIDDYNFICQMKESGGKSVDTCRRVFEYIQLAITFWEKRAEAFCEKDRVEEKYRSMNGKTKQEIESDFCELVDYLECNLMHS